MLSLLVLLKSRFHVPSHDGLQKSPAPINRTLYNIPWVTSLSMWNDFSCEYPPFMLHNWLSKTMLTLWWTISLIFYFWCTSMFRILSFHFICWVILCQQCIWSCSHFLLWQLHKVHVSELYIKVANIIIQHRSVLTVIWISCLFHSPLAKHSKTL